MAREDVPCEPGPVGGVELGGVGAADELVEGPGYPGEPKVAGVSRVYDTGHKCQEDANVIGRGTGQSLKV